MRPEDDPLAEYQSRLEDIFILQRDEDRLHGRCGPLPDIERFVGRERHDCGSSGSNKARVWQESALLLAYGLGIDDTHMASLRVSATSRADDEE